MDGWVRVSAHGGNVVPDGQVAARPQAADAVGRGESRRWRRGLGQADDVGGRGGTPGAGLQPAVRVHRAARYVRRLLNIMDLIRGKIPSPVSMDELENMPTRLASRSRSRDYGRSASRDDDLANLWYALDDADVDVLDDALNDSCAFKRRGFHCHSCR